MSTAAAAISAMQPSPGAPGCPDTARDLGSLHAAWGPSGCHVRILVVDDDRAGLMLLSHILRKWGHDVVQAGDGQQAWEILEQQRIGIVISDWVMPGLDGPELCRRIRDAGLPWYVYVILLTARGEKNALVEGLDAGADDFIVKPFKKDELEVRLRAGERVLRLERDLEERNARLREAQTLARQDLEAAAALQKNLLPPSGSRQPGIRASWMFVPCGYVAGDTFNYFSLDDHRTAFYLLDVAGHGVAAAMLSFTLSTILAPGDHREPRMRPQGRSAAPRHDPASPVEVVQELNRRFQDERDAMNYFTMIYGVVDAAERTIRLTQAGHPPAILLDLAGARELGDSGFPVGMLGGLEYEEIQASFAPGSRLILYSDGITECRNAHGEQFAQDRLLRHVERQRESQLESVLSGLEAELRQWKGSAEFDDDVTLLALESV